MNNGISRKWKCGAAILGVAALLPVIGCGGSSDVGKVTGVVTLDGQPVPDASVEFTPEGEGRPSSGRTDENGEYELAYTATEMGAMIGKHTVKISTAGMKEDADGNLTPVKETVPAQYNEKTTLTAEVESGKNKIDFDLKSK